MFATRYFIFKSSGVYCAEGLPIAQNPATRKNMWLGLSVLLALSAIANGTELTFDCLEEEATKINEGGIIADCSLHGLSRLSTVMPWLGNITVLQVANISHNKIIYLSKFPLLPRLLTLVLSHNKIKELESLAVVNLVNLQTLDLSYNRISGEALRADVLKGRYSPDHYEPLLIRVLLLGNNEIHSLNRRVFEHLNYLRELRLDNNPLGVIDANTQMALQSLSELKILDLARTGLSYIPPDLFEHFELSTLYLNGNKLTTVPEGLGSLAGSLRVLNINQNPITELNENSFLGLRNLQEIIASGLSELTTIKANTFSKLKNLKLVSCSYNRKLSEIDRYAFWDGNQKFFLEQLLLNNNGLKRIPKYLLPWNKLDKITLEENPWVCDCRIKWLASLAVNKNTTIYRPYDLRCAEPTWLNGTFLVNWMFSSQDNIGKDLCEQEDEEEAGKVKSVQAQTTGHKLRNVLLGFAVLTIIIGIILGVMFYKYRHYRPLRTGNKTPTSLVNNEVRYMKADLAEKSHLVS